MKSRFFTHGKSKTLLLALTLAATSSVQALSAPDVNRITQTAQQPCSILKALNINPTTVQLRLSNGHLRTIDFYGENIFRIYEDPQGNVIKDPEAKPAAKILANHPRRSVKQLKLIEDQNQIKISTEKVQLVFDKKTTLMTVHDLSGAQTFLQEIQAPQFQKDRVTLRFKASDDEYFYGGGVQNGRFSHRGNIIAIENQNSWTDGGVASPNPFYWSTKGYGLMWHTFKKGEYDFSNKQKGVTQLTHSTDYMDVFIMIDTHPIALLNDYYQLTGHPLLLPKFGFYEGHLNAYNRDYWKESKDGILFEDGKHYKESSKNEGGIKESLNGEKNNYQFSARAVIDRYLNHDMPLGWLLPNDGYGAGYGQTGTLDGNISNLAELTRYAHDKGVEIGLWTQSDLHPKEGVEPLLQRDIIKEIRDAGVRILKTDVAWVGAGYSFGLNGITDAAHAMRYYGNDARPFIISLDGWAGTQRHAAIWTGDQTGGNWEYIRFHIPTYIGSGLSGNPNITSDMDGIFGGKNPIVNIRDFQWKTFTPMQLNMDGWGSNEKYPHALGQPATALNRMYLKWKSMLLPYTYSIAKQATDGMPIIRAMMLQESNPYTLGKETQYQYMYGPYFLIAPIYKDTQSDKQGNDIRNNIYLPEGLWIDYFTGNAYNGGVIINNFDAPIWKLPVFVKAGAIIPFTNANNNVSEISKKHRAYEIYPYGDQEFTEYDDDGTTEAYKKGCYAQTLIKTSYGKKNTLCIGIAPTKGDFDGFEHQKSTEIKVNCTQKPGNIQVKTTEKTIRLKEVHSKKEYESLDNVYYYEEKPEIPTFIKASEQASVALAPIVKNPMLNIKIQSLDITRQPLIIRVDKLIYDTSNKLLAQKGALNAPTLSNDDQHTTAYEISAQWDKVNNADYYEIKFDSMTYTQIRDTHLTFENLQPETQYQFAIRSVNRDGHSDWSTATLKTKANPLEFAIKGILPSTSVPNQGYSVDRIFDFKEGEIWHTKYNKKAVPFDLTADLRSINQLNKFVYVPRENAGNGNFIQGKVSYSMDGQKWEEAGSFEWKADNTPKTFEFKQKPTAGYIQIHVTKAVGDYGSAKEIYVFKVPGSPSYIPGDINNDKLIDYNDLTSYTNYTGLRAGDSDFEGYISKGDINNNGLIDAFDISHVATRLEGEVELVENQEIQGKVYVTTPKNHYKKGETIEINVMGKGLKNVNAMSFCMPYDTKQCQWLGIKTQNTGEMLNMTYDRLHSNGKKAIYPTFVNIGQKPTLEGDKPLFVIQMKALSDIKFVPQVKDGIIVSSMLKCIKF